MNFEYYNPTRLIFAAGSLFRLGELARQYGKRALLVTGGGSVKRNGTFDRALRSLTEAGISVFECEGVEPNPKITSVKRGAATARDRDCDLMIALGGGSVMDASKVMAAAVLYDGDPWDMTFHGQPNPYVPTRALPLITVPTTNSCKAISSATCLGAASWITKAVRLPRSPPWRALRASTLSSSPTSPLPPTWG
jgi:alcohol dehydrogenase YqhD (iron-dependent ADH family)